MKVRIHIQIEKSTLERLKKHFPSERSLSDGVDTCIRFFDENNITMNEIKYLLSKLSNSHAPPTKYIKKNPKINENYMEVNNEN